MLYRAACSLTKVSRLASVASDPESLVADAARYLSAGDLASAELACRTLLSTTPRQVSANTLLGAVLLSQGRFAWRRTMSSPI